MSARRGRAVQATTEKEDEWIWGTSNQRGGAGAPLKQGADLRLLTRPAASNAYDDDLGWKGGQNSSNSSNNNKGSTNEQQSRRGRQQAYDGNEYSQSPRNNNNGNNATTGSPQKFLSALRGMHGSETARDREDKFLREQTYQAQLREQIEEKRRLKQMEASKTELEMERELKKYAAAAAGRQQSPRFPAPLLVKPPGRRSQFEPSEPPQAAQYVERNREPKMSPRGAQRGYKSSNTNNDNRDYPTAGRGGRRGQDYDDEDESDSHEQYGSPPRRANMRPAARSEEEGSESYVARKEYEALNDRYGALVEQQEALQREVEKQARVIQQLQIQRNNNNAKPAAGTQQQKVRSQSVRVATRDARPPNTGRPLSNNAPYSAAAGASRAVPAGVGFGSKQALPRNEGISKYKGPQPDVIAAAVGGGRRDLAQDAGGRGKGNSRVNFQAPPQQQQQQLRRDPSGGGGGGGGSPQGFARLQQMAARGKPVVATYDDADDSYAIQGSSYSNNNNNNLGQIKKLNLSNVGGVGGGGISSAKSTELRGESVYLKVQQSSQEVLSEDQLDRLLNRQQSKGSSRRY